MVHLQSVALLLAAIRSHASASAAAVGYACEACACRRGGVGQQRLAARVPGEQDEPRLRAASECDRLDSARLLFVTRLPPIPVCLLPVIYIYIYIYTYMFTLFLYVYKYIYAYTHIYKLQVYSYIYIYVYI